MLKQINEETTGELIVHAKGHYSHNGDLSIEIPMTFWNGLSVTGDLYIDSDVRVANYCFVQGKIIVSSGILTVVPAID